MTVFSSSPSLSSMIKGPALLPIIQADSAAQAVQIAKSMQQGGISAVEVVLRTAAALAEHLSRLAAEADARRQRDGERGGEERGAEVADHDRPHFL